MTDSVVSRFSISNFKLGCTLFIIWWKWSAVSSLVVQSSIEQTNAHKTFNETLNLPTQNGHTLRSLTFLNDSIAGSLTFLEKKTSQYALPTNPTRAQTSPIPHLHGAQMH